jgi:hypothetical protein
METVHDQPECRMVRHLHDLPGVLPAIDVPTPGERFVADPHPALGRTLRHLREVGGGTALIGAGRGLGIAAYQNETRSERLHDIEFALGAIHVSRMLSTRHRLEVTERLEDVDRQASAFASRRISAGNPPKVRRSFSKILDAVKADCGSRVQLFR